jgi:hypothetical protein
MQNHHITKLRNIKLQSYKLHVFIHIFQILNFKNKLQVHVYKYIKLPNYHNYHNTKLIIKILQFDKLQVCIFKFTILYLYVKLPNQITKITKL